MGGTGIRGLGSGHGDVLGIAFADREEPALVLLDHRVERTEEGDLLLVIHFRSAASQPPVELDAEVRLRPGQPVVEYRSRVRNLGQRELLLTRLDAARFMLHGAPDARWRAAVLDTAGQVWLSSLGADNALVAAAPVLSAAYEPVVPSLVVHDAAAEEGVILALRWSSNYRLAVRALDEQRVLVEAGLSLQDAAPRSGGAAPPPAEGAEAVEGAEAEGLHLPPGAVVESPWLLLSLFAGQLDDASIALRRYLADTRPHEPRWVAESLPVGWNSWFAYGPGVDHESMRAEAAIARDLGVEVFYVDYGWSSAIGDWVPHPERFPGDTLVRLGQEVRHLGLRFGLWVAFGVAGRDSDLVRLHPEFVARQPEPGRRGIDGSLPLCLT